MHYGQIETVLKTIASAGTETRPTSGDLDRTGFAQAKTPILSRSDYTFCSATSAEQNVCVCRAQRAANLYFLKQRRNDGRQDNSNVEFLAVGVRRYWHPLELQAQFHGHLAKEVRLVDPKPDGNGPAIVAVRLPVCGDGRCR